MRQRTFRWQRHQHSVGHGFFHSATLTCEGRHTLPPFHYIYDCGAKKVRGLLAPAIDEFCQTLKGRPIDLMILSHFHSDHIGGLDILLARKEVRRVIIPYLTESERLLLIGQLLTKQDARFDELQRAADPGRWLRSRGVESVITVQPTDVTQPWQDRGIGAQGQEEEIWTLRSTIGGSLPVRGEIKISHQTPLKAVVSSRPTLDFHFYCWQAQTLHARMKELWDSVDLPSMTEILDPDHLAQNLRSNTVRRRLIRCYHDVVQNKSLNWTTLCALISPDPGALPGGYQTFFGASRWLFPPIWPNDMGWLGTGDLELGREAVRDEFLSHYKDASPVASLSLPHHGSRLNFDAKLISHFKPGLAFATVPPGSAKHPDPRVLLAVRREGIDVFLVDNNACNALHEDVRFIV